MHWMRKMRTALSAEYIHQRGIEEGKKGTGGTGLPAGPLYCKKDHEVIVG